MRQWLAIALFVLLPLQWSWAAVAAYCGHDGTSTAQARHLGHHEHMHDAAAQADAPTDRGSIGHASAAGADDHSSPVAGGQASLHFDCGHCHATHAALVVDLTSWLQLAPLSQPEPSAVTAWHSLPAPRPERPQWARLA